MGEEIEMLKDHADTLPYLIDVNRTASNAVTFELNIAALDGFKLIDAAQERALARAGRPDQHGNRTLLDIKIDAL